MFPDASEQFWGSNITGEVPLHEMDSCVSMKGVFHELQGGMSECCKVPALTEEGAAAAVVAVASNPTDRLQRRCSEDRGRGVQTSSAAR